MDTFPSSPARQTLHCPLPIACSYYFGTSNSWLLLCSPQVAILHPSATYLDHFFFLGKLPGDCPIMSKTRYYLNCLSRRQRLVTRDEQKRENYLHYSILLTAYEPCKLSNESMVFILQARFACTYCSYNLQVRKKSSCVMEALCINLTCCAYLYTITLFYTNIYNIFRPNQFLLEYKSWETVDAIRD